MITPNDILDYESGEMDEERIAVFFQELIDTGLVWKLQGSYGRMVQKLIAEGICEVKGKYYST